MESRIEPGYLADFAEREGARFGAFQFCWPEMWQRLPRRWLLAEAWIGPRNVIFHDLTIGFMARDEVSAARMRRGLDRAVIPPDVRRLDARSDLVRTYNRTLDKDAATAELCNKASIMVIGEPDAAYAHYRSQCGLKAG